MKEHYIDVYSNKVTEQMVKAPQYLLHGNLVSLSLEAAIINGKM